MIYYVNQAMLHDGDGSLGTPFRRISEAAKIAKPGDEVLVFPGVYREYVNPERGGTEDAPILYRSIEPLGAVICGAERIKGWTPYQGTVWTVRVKNSTFGAYNPYTTEVFGDWYFAPTVRHTGAVYLNDQMLYEAESLEECIAGEIYKPSWDPQGSTFKWFSEQDGRWKLTSAAAASSRRKQAAGTSRCMASKSRRPRRHGRRQLRFRMA